MDVNVDLTTIWAFIIAFAVFAYVVMDGFDLGIGILFPTFEVGPERDGAMNSIAPVWDGNETWLVLGGGGLFAALPIGLRGDPARHLPAHHRHAVGTGVPRCRVRVSLARPRAHADTGTRTSLAARWSRRWRRA